MSIFDLFKPKPKLTLSYEEQQWNMMWDLWCEGRAASPYQELMTYQSEVNNGGHSQYFFNTANNGDLKAEVAVLLPILPPPHAENLRKGYEAFAAMADIADDDCDDLLDECDDVFYANEAAINDLLRAYADTIVL